jgi:hypothetical protein
MVIHGDQRACPCGASMFTASGQNAPTASESEAYRNLMQSLTGTPRKPLPKCLNASGPAGYPCRTVAHSTKSRTSRGYRQSCRKDRTCRCSGLCLLAITFHFHGPKPHHDDEIVAAASAAERESLITRAGTPWQTCCAGTPNLALCGDTEIRDFIRHTRSEAPITRAHCDIATRRTDAYLIYLHGQFSTLNTTQLLQSLPGLRDANTNGSSRNGSSWPSNTGLTHAAVEYLTMYNIVI